MYVKSLFAFDCFWVTDKDLKCCLCIFQCYPHCCNMYLQLPYWFRPCDCGGIRSHPAGCAEGPCSHHGYYRVPIWPGERHLQVPSLAHGARTAATIVTGQKPLMTVGLLTTKIQHHHLISNLHNYGGKHISLAYLEEQVILKIKANVVF